MDEEKGILKLDMDCVICGQPAVAESTLCASCLARLCDIYEQKLKTAACKIERLQQANETVNEILNEALAYGFKQNQENMVLQRKMAELYKRINRRLKSGKKRVQEDK